MKGTNTSSLLTPAQLHHIGSTLLRIPHIRRIRFASKGLCVSPSRTLDPHDNWTAALISVVQLGRSLGKHVALHTHFNHVNEFTWVSREAAQRLMEAGVTVRNQSVLLKGVNDSVESMALLLRELADSAIIPVRCPHSVLLDCPSNRTNNTAQYLVLHLST